MNSQPACCSRATLNWTGVVGAFLVMVILVAALRHYTRIEDVNLDRTRERAKALADARQKDSVELATADWIDKEKNLIRLPNSVAMALTVEQWRDPAQARALLLERADKAFAIPPPPPEPPSEFE